MDKKELRKLMLEERRLFTLEEVEARSEQICDHFFAGFSPETPQTVHVFLPILKHRELNTWLIIRKLWSEFPDCRVAVPVTNFEANKLEHYFITPETEIVENHWGIPEPVNAEQAFEPDLDTVLLPLLAFDLKGNRLGYGKGYYDRFLKLCHPEVLKIGLSLLPPVAEVPGINDWDMPLDHCLTPAKRYDF